MKTTLDCLSCFVRQALDAARMATDDEQIQSGIMSHVLHHIADMDLEVSPVKTAEIFHGLIREKTGMDDPYKAVKDKFNQLILELIPKLRDQIQNSPNPLETAVRLAIGGNIIDFGAQGGLEEEHVHEAIQHALTAPLNGGSIDIFLSAINKAERILYIADNAGEIVFDRLLIEQLPAERIIVAVRGGPVINDATLEDAEMVGLTNIVDVISNGSRAPGTVLETCSPDFRKQFDRADLIIAKGQGNYESLSESNRNIIFMLRVKCKVTENDIGFPIGSQILKQING